MQLGTVCRRMFAAEEDVGQFPVSETVVVVSCHVVALKKKRMIQARKDVDDVDHVPAVGVEDRTLHCDHPCRNIGIVLLGAMPWLY